MIPFQELPVIKICQLTALWKYFYGCVNIRLTYLNVGPDRFEREREGEIWSLGPNNYLDHEGNIVTAKKILLTSNLNKKAQDLPEVT